MFLFVIVQFQVHATVVIICCLYWRSNNGTLVVYGNMSSKAHTVSVEALLLKNIKVQGFSLDRYAVVFAFGFRNTLRF